MPSAHRFAVAVALSFLGTSSAVRSHDVEELAMMNTEEEQAEVSELHSGNSSAVQSGEQAEFAARSGHSTQVQLGVGHVLDGRYVLKRFLGRFDSRGGVKPWEVGTYPFVKTAMIVKKHLGKGSFGDTWLAESRTLKKLVAIKIFYDGQYYLTPKLVKEKHLEKDIEEGATECLRTQELMTHRESYEKGAQHICECYEAHTTDDREDSVLFLAQEACGLSFKDLFTKSIEEAKWFAKENQQLHQHTDWMAKAVIDTLEGVKFLSKLGYTHHDLKLENVAVSEDGVAKLIDFGGLMSMDEAMKSGGTCSPYFAPPEVTCPGYGPGVSPTAPIYSYDDYSVGLMLFEAVCKEREHNHRDLGHCSHKNPVNDEVLGVARKLTSLVPTERPDPAEAAKELRALLNIEG
mmetsp:Transcript_67277/g.179207  ORF Transcript_67277/g.179207 Transcript_67277/m.179207 type:complete len:404 (-) Transcript_67277:60-1271(-)|eukprot:CAMPEP_0171188164 /NCGR_PEP_ID=MMETSP0790-20130122/17689_1 /TAXON_ID=2925 /ORGANISM="Alexandrium catenella, Strain OF101" /LENGTH=403 /DNA_ID=CAMNT_0011653235 /DNA_START=63 /DNA_END=1274 /DNA_ORIENTATION=-